MVEKGSSDSQERGIFIDRRKWPHIACAVYHESRNPPPMAASPILSNFESIYGRDQISSHAKRKWAGQQLNVFPNIEGSRKESRLASGHDGERRDIVRRKSAEKLEIRGRQLSLRHVKNSKEVLRQRSMKRAVKDGGIEGNSGAREGRQFTVANVGNNGKIYLR